MCADDITLFVVIPARCNNLNGVVKVKLCKPVLAGTLSLVVPPTFERVRVCRKMSKIDFGTRDLFTPKLSTDVGISISSAKYRLFVKNIEILIIM